MGAGDEGLGGALLTPIPWLREDVDAAEDRALSPVVGAGPNGAEVPALGAEDVGPQPEGTVFPDAPRTGEGVEREEDMADAPEGGGEVKKAEAAEGEGAGAEEKMVGVEVGTTEEEKKDEMTGVEGGGGGGNAGDEEKKDEMAVEESGKMTMEEGEKMVVEEGEKMAGVVEEPDKMVEDGEKKE